MVFLLSICIRFSSFLRVQNIQSASCPARFTIVIHTTLRRHPLLGGANRPVCFSPWTSSFAHQDRGFESAVHDMLPPPPPAAPRNSTAAGHMETPLRSVEGVSGRPSPVGAGPLFGTPTPSFVSCFHFPCFVLWSD